MHIAAVSTVFFAALAAADSHGHARRFHHRRAINETMTSAMTTPPTTAETVPLTTLTVHQTIVHTITNCGKNITETTCGGKDATVDVVTKTIDLTTIVCPVTEADAISSSVIASAGSTAPVVVEATQTVVPVVEESNASPNGPEPTPVGDTESTVLSYTLGPETSQTVITTTYFNTKTTSDHVTKYITYDNSPDTVTVIAPVIPEQTTTLSSTTTSTRTVTVPADPTASDSDASPEGSNPACPDGESCPETPSGSDNEVPTDNKTPAEGAEGAEGAEDCPAPVTVTETIALSTVTVTGTAAPSAIEDNDSTSETPAENEDATTTDRPEGELPEATGVPAVPAPVEDNTEETKPVAEEPEPVIVDDVIFVVPTKYENATAPHATGNAGPSGFITQSRPSGTGAPIEPAPTAKGFFGY